MEEKSKNKIGFILITHSHPDQVLRLANRLNALYSFPPIVSHHDFSQCALPLDRFTPNITFLRPHLQTRWAEFPVVEAIIRCIRLMLERTDCPDWFVLLSGADYPIKPAWKVLQDLNGGPYDAYIEHTLIDPKQCETGWQRQCCERYLRKVISIPWMTRKRRFLWRKLSLPRRMSSFFLPFSNDFHCYAGSLWFTFNRRAADYIVKETQANPRSYGHFGSINFSDEAYFQTTLLNAKNLKCHGSNYRYLDWSSGGWHPRTLDMADIPKAIASSDHFARKFGVDRVDVLDAIDAAVDRL